MINKKYINNNILNMIIKSIIIDCDNEIINVKCQDLGAKGELFYYLDFFELNQESKTIEDTIIEVCKIGHKGLKK